MSAIATSGERSIGELFGELATETSTLVRQEVKLATLELTQKAAYAGRQLVYIGIGALLAVIAALSCLAAAIIALSHVIPLWSAALAVGAAVAVVAVAAVTKGVAALGHMDLTPTQTMKSLEDDKSWARTKIR